LTAVMIASSLLIAASVPPSAMLRLRMGESNRGEEVPSQCLEPRTTLVNGALDQRPEIVGLAVWRQNGVTCLQQSRLNCWKRELRKLDAASGRSTSQMTQPQSASQEVLAGYIERVTYHNAENGFCVLRTKARGHRDVVTVVGHAAIISAGEWI